MSVIFFCADFFSFSYLKSASDSFRGVHKQYGPGRERGRQFYPIYLVTWFIVHRGSSNSLYIQTARFHNIEVNFSPQIFDFIE